MKEIIIYEACARGNNVVACELRPLNGPLNQYMRRTLVELKDGDRIVKYEDFQYAVDFLKDELHKLKARLATYG